MQKLKKKIAFLAESLRTSTQFIM